MRGVMVVTDRRQARLPLSQLVAEAAAAGARWVLLRERELPRAQRYALAQELRSVLAPAGGQLVVAGPDPLGGNAVHLSATEPAPAASGPASAASGIGPGPAASGTGPVPAASGIGPAPAASIMELPHDTPGEFHDRRREEGSAALVGRSCHSETELARLTTEDYVTVSPVYPSASKPGYGPALGPDGLARLCRLAGGRPVLALGGIETPAQAAACIDAGAAGVAVMGAVMRAADPAAVVAGLQEAVSG